MYRLLNRCDYFENSVDELQEQMEMFKKKFNLDGFELIRYNEADLSLIKNEIIGYHLRFFPSIMDLYRENYKKLFNELKTEENIKNLCGGTNKKELIEYYKKDLQMAKDLGAKYVVFHPCNIYILESFHYNFCYSNMEVLKVMVDFLNEILNDEEYDFTLLLENLWWPGLRLDNYEEADYLMKNIHYTNKGFVLDTGHMLNNNRELQSMEEGVEYIKSCLENLKEYKHYIYAVHLNGSLSGEYQKKMIQKHKGLKNFDYAMKNVYEHIYNIDSHKPFKCDKIHEVLNDLPLKYLVYEIIFPEEVPSL